MTVGKEKLNALKRALQCDVVRVVSALEVAQRAGWSPGGVRDRLNRAQCWVSKPGVGWERRGCLEESGRGCPILRQRHYDGFGLLADWEKPAVEILAQARDEEKRHEEEKDRKLGLG